MPPVRTADGIELKFNPWHDPTDGRFTFAGAGSTQGVGTRDSRQPRLRRGARGGSSKSTGGPPAGPDPRIYSKISPKAKAGNAKQSHPIGKFAGGAGEGLYDAVKETVTGTYSLLTTNPVTTIKDINSGVAAMIDGALAAEDTPAHVQVQRAASAVAHMSPHDLGHVVGSTVGDAASAVAPGAALSKVSRLRYLRTLRPHTVYESPKIKNMKENLGKEPAPWKDYNNGAEGAQPGFAPALMRTMPDGSMRPVKFDGIDGDYVIDRKWAVVNRPRARAQALRQSEVLAQHRLVGTWEVPDEIQKVKALKLFKDLKYAISR
ncbi:hypothetical protein GCM10022253_10720 [Sphingomonas endophytica]